MPMLRKFPARNRVEEENPDEGNQRLILKKSKIYASNFLDDEENFKGNFCIFDADSEKKLKLTTRSKLLQKKV